MTVTSAPPYLETMKALGAASAGKKGQRSTMDSNVGSF